VGDFGNCARLSALAEERCGPSKCRFCYGKCRFCLPHPDRLTRRAAVPQFGGAVTSAEQVFKGELDAGFFGFGAARRLTSLMAKTLRILKVR